MRSSIIRVLLAIVVVAALGTAGGPISITESAYAEGSGGGFPPGFDDSTASTSAALEPEAEGYEVNLTLLDYLSLSSLLLIL